LANKNINITLVNGLDGITDTITNTVTGLPTVRRSADRHWRGFKKRNGDNNNNFVRTHYSAALYEKEVIHD
jgi:hypothetical protein